MPKRFDCRARFLSDDPAKQDADDSCNGYSTLVYKRATVESDGKDQQKRAYEPIGLFCDRCQVFMTIEQYKALEPRIIEKISRDAYARAKWDAIQRVKEVRYHVKNKTEDEEQIKTGRRKAYSYEKDDDERVKDGYVQLSEEDMERNKRYFAWYYAPPHKKTYITYRKGKPVEVESPNGEMERGGMYWNDVSPEAQQEAQELTDKFGITDKDIKMAPESYHKSAWRDLRQRERYTERLKRSLPPAEPEPMAAKPITGNKKKSKTKGKKNKK
jgi:hypothetical protein